MKVLVYGSGVIRYSFTQCSNAEFAKRHPLAQAYELVKKENGLLVSVKK